MIKKKNDLLNIINYRNKTTLFNFYWPVLTTGRNLQKIKITMYVNPKQKRVLVVPKLSTPFSRSNPLSLSLSHFCISTAISKEISIPYLSQEVKKYIKKESNQREKTMINVITIIVLDNRRRTKEFPLHCNRSWSKSGSLLLLLSDEIQILYS